MPNTSHERIGWPMVRFDDSSYSRDGDNGATSHHQGTYHHSNPSSHHIYHSNNSNYHSNGSINGGIRYLGNGIGSFRTSTVCRHPECHRAIGNYCRDCYYATLCDCYHSDHRCCYHDDEMHHHGDVNGCCSEFEPRYGNGITRNGDLMETRFGSEVTRIYGEESYLPPVELPSPTSSSVYASMMRNTTSIPTSLSSKDAIPCCTIV